ncbi:hypothetical protein Cni_G13263 [Canna indica]|uniref:Cytochrome P450 n=1 Tax=Canna indica TaxID=4628 RepID=A0AAQ3K9Y6_9LILI|nr:hypothetical protein Cni_G13263 [Canna indica]
MIARSLVELVHSRLLPLLEDVAASGGSAPIDLLDVLLRLTFDNGCRSPFAKAFKDATEDTIICFITPTTIWRALRYFDLGNERWLRRSLQRVDEFAYNVIRTRKKELAMESSSPSDKSTTRSDLLTVFAKHKDEDGNPFSEKFLCDICVNFILAGCDTSSVALAWFFWLLNKHPKVEENIFAEIKKCRRRRRAGVHAGGGEEDGVLAGDSLKSAPSAKCSRLFYYQLFLLDNVWTKVTWR